MLKEYFTFSKGERNGALLLIVTSALLFIGVRAYYYIYPVSEAFAGCPGSAKVDSFIAAYNKNSQQPVAVVADFDPNLLSVEEWKQLGFSEKQAMAIVGYRTKRGGFKRPEDLKLVYVIDEARYTQLLPHVKISSIQPEDYEDAYPGLHIKVEINSADSAAFVRVDGIGPYYARKIIKYRNELGGFVAVEQVKEVWGMPHSLYQRVKPQLTCIPKVKRKLNVNTDDLEMLKQHPYVRTALARIIIKRRTKYGDFTAIEDLRRIVQIDDSLYQKLEPYVTVK